MPTEESLRETLAFFKQQRDKKIQEVRASFEVTIQQIERELGEAPSSESPINIGDYVPPVMERGAEIPNGRRPEIRPDEFFGMTQAEAARQYLKKIGHAVSFEELVVALQAGGCKVGGENPKRVLYISLIRNTRDFVPPRQGFIGLRDFYPGAARPPKDKPDRRNKKRARKSKKVRAGGKRRGRPPKNPMTPPKPARGPSEIGKAVQSVLSDRQAHSFEEILSAVSTKVGKVVGKIAIRGSLNSRDIEKTDGKYRLVK